MYTKHMRFNSFANNFRAGLRQSGFHSSGISPSQIGSSKTPARMSTAQPIRPSVFQPSYGNTHVVHGYSSAANRSKNQVTADLQQGTTPPIGEPISSRIDTDPEKRDYAAERTARLNGNKDPRFKPINKRYGFRAAKDKELSRYEQRLKYGSERQPHTFTESTHHRYNPYG